MISLLQL